MVMASYALVAVLVVGAGVGIWRLLPMSTRGEMTAAPLRRMPTRGARVLSSADVVLPLD